jgi:hypothetical protein
MSCAFAVASSLRCPAIAAKTEGDLARRDALLHELRALARNYPDDAAVREQLANGLWRTLDDAKAEGALTRRNALLDELCTLARSYPDDAAVRERLTGALVNTLLGAKAKEDRAHRDALLKELCGLARSYPDDAAVRQLSSAAFDTGKSDAMPFVWIGAEEPILEKRRRERAESRLAELHFKWLDAVATGDRATAIQAQRLIGMTLPRRRMGKNLSRTC